MKKILIFAVLLAACGRSLLPGEPLDYQAPDGSFSAKVPAGRRVDEGAGETRKAAFFGPPNGDKPFSDLMGVYFQPGAVAASDLARDVTTNRETVDAHLGPQRVTTRTVTVPVPGGLFLLEHTWPTASNPSPAFDELVRTFRPGSSK